MKYYINNWLIENLETMPRYSELTEEDDKRLYCEIRNAELQGLVNNIKLKWESGYKCENKTNSLLLWVFELTDTYPTAPIKIKSEGSYPDIDQDMPQGARGRVIKYTIEKYDEDKVSQVATLGKLKAKAALRSAARALGYTVAEGDILAKMIPNLPDVTLSDSLEASDELKELIKSEPSKDIWDTACALEDLPNSLGVHASALVITDLPMDAYFPLMISKKDNAVLTQYEYKDVEANFAIKFD